MRLNHFIESTNVALAQRQRKLMELQHIVFLEQFLAGQIAEQHFHRHQIDEDEAFVARKMRRTVAESEAEELVGRLVVGVEHGFAADKVFVGDLLGDRKVILVDGTVDGPDEGFAEIQLVDAEVDLEQLVDEVQHAEAFGVLVGGAVFFFGNTILFLNNDVYRNYLIGYS